MTGPSRLAARWRCHGSWICCQYQDAPMCNTMTGESTVEVEFQVHWVDAARRPRTARLHSEERLRQFTKVMKATVTAIERRTVTTTPWETVQSDDDLDPVELARRAAAPGRHSLEYVAAEFGVDLNDDDAGVRVVPPVPGDGGGAAT